VKSKQKLTAAKIAANQNNARNSTGPKSTRGKRYSSRNAIKHGIFSADMLLPGENEETYSEMLQGLVSALRPLGACEFSLVEELSWCRWRLRRVYPAEAAEIKIPIAALQPRPETIAHAAAEKRVIGEISRLEQIESQIELDAWVNTESVEWLQKLMYRDAVKDFLRYVECLQKVEIRSRPNLDGPEAQKNDPTNTEYFDTRKLEWDNFAREAMTKIRSS
jgi:hypothetical protein